jgi:CP family cyanate transporter-like MFS transporter
VTAADPRSRRGLVWAGLAMSWLSAVNCRAPFVATGALLPLVIPALRLSTGVAGLLTAVPLLVLAALSVPGGLWGDRVGPRVVLLATQLIIAAGGALRGLAHGPALFLFGVAVLGGGIGLAQPALAQAAKRLAVGRETLSTTVYTTGLVLGGLLGTALTAPILLPLAGGSWRGAFGLWALLGLVAGAGWALLPLPPAPPPDPPEARSPGRPAMPGFWPLVIVFATESAIFYGLVSWLPDYYVAHGWTVAGAAGPASAVSVGSVVGVLATPALARAAGGFRQPLVAMGGLDLAAQVGLLLLPGWGWLWAGLIGAATAVALTLGMAAPAVLMPAEHTGRTAGLLLALGYGAAVLGPEGIGLLRQWSGTFVAGFALLAVLAALWTVAAWRLPATPSGT